jgi:hypothetical protein
VLISEVHRAGLIRDGSGLLPAVPLSAALPEAVDALWRARDYAGLSRRCAEPDALALDEEDPLLAIVRFWGVAARA